MFGKLCFSPEAASVRVRLINHGFCNLTKLHKAQRGLVLKSRVKMKGDRRALLRSSGSSSTCRRKRPDKERCFCLFFRYLQQKKKVQNLHCVVFAASLGHSVLLQNVFVVILCAE